MGEDMERAVGVALERTDELAQVLSRGLRRVPSWLLLLLILCGFAPCPCLPVLEPAVPRPLAVLRGGGGRLKMSSAVNFLTGEAIEDLAVVDVDSGHDFADAKPVEWLPRGPFLFPEERDKLAAYDDHGDSSPEHGEPQSPQSLRGRRSHKSSRLSHWQAQLQARFAVLKSRVQEAAAQATLDLASKYSCGLGEHWARHVLAGRKSRRRKEKRVAAELAKSGRKVRKASSSPSSACLPFHVGHAATPAYCLGFQADENVVSKPASRGRVDQRHGADHEENFDSDSSSELSSLSDLSSSGEDEEVFQDDYGDVEYLEPNSAPWLAGNVTRPSKGEVSSRAAQVALMAEESDGMPEVAALCRQCVRLCKVLAVVGDQAPTEASSGFLASLGDSLSRAEALLTRIRRMRWWLLPVGSKLLRQVLEIAAEISELLEEGGDALMDLLPVGVSMIINNGAARACWRKWLGAHAISGSKKKLKWCLAVELSRTLETYGSIPLLDPALNTSVPLPNMLIPPHVVEAAAEALCLMSFCAQAPDEVDVLAWNVAFPGSVHMVVALEALVAAQTVFKPVLSSLRSARSHLYGVSAIMRSGDGGTVFEENDVSCSASEDEDDASDSGKHVAATDSVEEKSERSVGLRKLRSCGIHLLKAVLEDTRDVHSKADLVLNAVVMEYPAALSKTWEDQREGLERIGGLVSFFHDAATRLQLSQAARSVASENETSRDEMGKDGEREGYSKEGSAAHMGEQRSQIQLAQTMNHTSTLSKSSVATTAGLEAEQTLMSKVAAESVAAEKAVAEERRSVEELLLKSAHSGQVGACLYYVLYCGVSLDIRDDRGNAAIHIAAAQGHLDLVRALRYVGADILVENNDGLTPGALASCRGHKAVSSWFTFLGLNSRIDTGAQEELQVVLSSLSRLAHSKPPLPPPRHPPLAGEGGEGIVFRLPPGPLAWSTPVNKDRNYVKHCEGSNDLGSNISISAPSANLSQLIPKGGTTSMPSANLSQLIQKGGTTSKKRENVLPTKPDHMPCLRPAAQLTRRLAPIQPTTICRDSANVAQNAEIPKAGLCDIIPSASVASPNIVGRVTSPAGDGGGRGRATGVDSAAASKSAGADAGVFGLVDGGVRQSAPSVNSSADGGNSDSKSSKWEFKLSSLSTGGFFDSQSPQPLPAKPPASLHESCSSTYMPPAVQPPPIPSSPMPPPSADLEKPAHRVCAGEFDQAVSETRTGTKRAAGTETVSAEEDRGATRLRG